MSFFTSQVHCHMSFIFKAGS